jgi:hypothetical protein
LPSRNGWICTKKPISLPFRLTQPVHQSQPFMYLWVSLLSSLIHAVSGLAIARGPVAIQVRIKDEGIGSRIFGIFFLIRLTRPHSLRQYLIFKMRPHVFLNGYKQLLRSMSRSMRLPKCGNEEVSGCFYSFHFLDELYYGSVRKMPQLIVTQIR